MEINIEFTLKGEKKEEEDPLELINDNNERTTEETKTEELNDNHSESNLVEEETKKELRIDDEKQDNILSIASKSEETFVTYHIHLIKENETIESIMSQYQVSKDTLENYNDLSKFNLGEKLIIPCNE
jgi:LysM repeat protein